MRIIRANINHEKGKLDRYFARCVGAGRAGEVMRHVPALQLEQMQKDCAFDYIRFHGLFHEEMNIVSRDADGNLQFCFNYIDLLFDQLQDAHIRPVVELGLMPLCMAEKDTTVFWWKMGVSAPKCMDEWSALVEAFVRHVTERYGEDEIRQWYFEVWNEPNHPSFFTESKDINAYFALYDAAAVAVRNVCPDYRVGGPATAGVVWLNELYDHCMENQVPLDFFTCHSYNAKGAFDPDGTASVALAPIHHMNTILREKCMPVKQRTGLPVLLTEWSSSYSSRDPIHDSYFSAPFMLYCIKNCEGVLDAFSYWTYTDIFEEVTPPTAPFHGGFGLFTVDSIPKPAYYAYAFLHQLGDTELVCDDANAYVCKDENGVQIVLWNITDPNLYKRGISDRTHFGRLLPAKKLDDVTIELSGMVPERVYTIETDTVGCEKGDAYSAYLAMGGGALKTRAQVEYLREKAKPVHETYYAKADANGLLRVTLPVCENQADLVKIK